MNSSHMRKTNVSIPPLLDIPFFDNLRKVTSLLNIQKLKSKLKLCYYSSGDVLLQSESEREFMYILKGKIALHLNEQNSNEEDEIKYVGQNQYFGETETVNQKRIIKVVAVTSAILYRLTLTGMYQHLRALFTFPELESKMSYIKSLPYFINSHEFSFERMIECSRDLKPSMNSVLYSQGQKVNSVYVIMRGDFQLSKKVKKSRAIYTIDVSTVSMGQCLGIQEVLMNQVSQETVKCVSSNAWIVQLQKQPIRDCMISCNRSLIKSRSNWRKQRVEEYQQIIERHRSTFTQMSESRQKDKQTHHQSYQSYDEYLRKKSSLKKTTYITNKKRSERPLTSSFTKKLDNSYFNLLPNEPKKMIKNKSEQQIGRKISNSELFFEQFLQKKQKVHNNMLMRYLKTRPPQLVFNPEKQYAVMKSLNVKPSNAVNNKKKMLAILKHKYFKHEFSFDKPKE